MLKLTARKKKWFTLPQDDTGETKIELVHLKPGVVADIESKASKVVGKQIGDDFHTEVDFRYREKLKTYAVTAIVDWEGFLNVKGTKMACTEANVLKVLKEFGWFAEQVQTFRDEFTEEVEAETEEEAKN